MWRARNPVRMLPRAVQDKSTIRRPAMMRRRSLNVSTFVLVVLASFAAGAFTQSPARSEKADKAGRDSAARTGSVAEGEFGGGAERASSRLLADRLENLSYALLAAADSSSSGQRVYRNV